MKELLFFCLLAAGVCAPIQADDHDGEKGDAPRAPGAGQARQDLVRQPFETEWCPNPNKVPLDQWELKLIELTNRERKRVNAKLPLLVPSQALMDFAREKSKGMANMHSMSHDVAPSAQTVATKTNKVTLENIAESAANVTKVIEVWIASTHHHANMLSDTTQFGGAVAWTKTGHPYWTQLFQK
jgi:uncharacterized protein YkwD